MAQPTTERRLHTRLEFQAPLQFRPSALLDANATDISEAGITIITDAAMTPGTELELFFVQRNIRLTGTVTHSDLHGQGTYRTGVQFLRNEQELVQVLLAAWSVQRL